MGGIARPIDVLSANMEVDYLRRDYLIGVMGTVNGKIPPQFANVVSKLPLSIFTYKMILHFASISLNIIFVFPNRMSS